jgi:hypothetical protein
MTLRKGEDILGTEREREREREQYIAVCGERS